MKSKPLVFCLLLFSLAAYPQSAPITKPAGETSLTEQQIFESNKLASMVRNAQITKENQRLDLLVSTNRVKRISAASEFGYERSVLINKLIKMLEGTNTINEKYPAVIVLGLYEATEAVPVLVKHLDWDDRVEGDTANMSMVNLVRSVEANCPVRFALSAIGMPAIPALLDRILETDDAKITTKCVIICQQIEGHDVIQFRLQGLLAKQTDPKKRTRVEAALEALEKDQRDQQEMKKRGEELQKNNK